MKQCDIVEHLVTVVPGVQGSLPGVVVHHANMRVLVVKGDVSVLIGGGIGVVGKVNLRSSKVGVCDIQGAAYHESFPCTPFGKPRVPALEDIQ